MNGLFIFCMALLAIVAGFNIGVGIVRKDKTSIGIGLFQTFVVLLCIVDKMTR